MTRSHRWSAGGLVLLLLASSPQRASGGEDEAVARAREYFYAGAQAYASGEYAAAVQAFEQAQVLAPRPAVLFSIAQAERRLFIVTREPGHLLRAIQLYREYLASSGEAARRQDAESALRELLAIAPAEPGPSASVPTQPEAVPRQDPTRLMVFSSAEKAQISLDGAAPTVSPLIQEVEPGLHRIAVSASGYLPVERALSAVKGELVAVDVALRESPALLVVEGRPGAMLSIDGRVQGTCPFPRSIEVTPGVHLITLTKSGYVGVSSERKLSRGEVTLLREPMPRSVQRTASLLMLGASASLVTAGGVIGYFTLAQERSARAFVDARGRAELTPQDLSEYDASRKDRDRLRTATLGTVGLGAVLGMAGAVLFMTDDGSVPTQKSERARAARALAPRSVTLVPLLGTDRVGVSAGMRF